MHPITAADTTAPLDFQRLRDALPPPAHVLYAPPHVFPMSVPDFATEPESERPAIPPDEPLGLYLHIPFCRYACNFCFYVKTVSASRDEMERTVRTLERELAAVPTGTKLNQLFVGGGTPTALPPDLLDAALDAALARMDRRKESIHTVECSPETVTPDHVEVLLKHGVRRISMGIQSTEDAVLAKVHRRHSGDEALEACRMLAASHLMLNVDLIYGLPGQTEKGFRDDLEAVVRAGADCVNIYNLRVNESTPVMDLLEEDERLELENLVRWRALVRCATEELGFVQTTWQRFLRRGLEFDLDLTSANLFGAGVSARSFLDGAVYRNHTSLRTYNERVEAGRSPVETVFRLDPESRRTYFVTRSLGAGKPLDLAAYEAAHGSAFEADHGEVQARLERCGLLENDGAQVRITEAGGLVWDLVTLAFYPPRLRAWLRQRHALAVARRRPKQQRR